MNTKKMLVLVMILAFILTACTEASLAAEENAEISAAGESSTSTEGEMEADTAAEGEAAAESEAEAGVSAEMDTEITAEAGVEVEAGAEGAADAGASVDAGVDIALGAGLTGDGSSSFPLPEDTSNVMADDTSVNFQTSASVEEMIDFYRGAFAQMGLNERTALTVIDDSTVSMVFDGHASGQAVVLQMVDLGITTNINIRLESV